MSTGIYIDGDIIVTIQELQNMINAASGSNTGVSTGDYSEGATSILRLEEAKPVGVIAGEFDPEWSAFMAGEF